MSLAKKTFFSSIILLSLAFINRSLGLISMLILARILTPDDFGIVAISSMVIFLFDSLSTSGSMQYIIQKKEVSDEDLNSAWTLNIILKGVFFIVCLILIPYIADFFNNDKLKPVLYLISAILPMTAAGNPGIYLLRKNLQFKPIFKLMTIQKVITTILVVLLALYYKSYWAMIVGTVSSYLIPTLGSYIIHSYRPKLHFGKIKEQWHFSQWIFLKSIVGYSKGQIDSFLVAKFFNVSSIGGYNLMKNLSTMPATEIVAPATEPLLSAFSKSKNNKKALNHQFNISLLVVIILISPIASFMYYFDSNIITILLGEKWLIYADILGILSIGLITLPVSSIINHYCTATGYVKTLFITDLISSISTILILVYFSDSRLEVIALLRVIINIIVQTGLLTYLKFSNSVPFLFAVKCISYYTGLSFVIAYCIHKFISFDFNSILLETISFLLIHFLTYLLIVIMSLGLKNHSREIQYFYDLLVKGLNMARLKLKSSGY